MKRLLSRILMQLFHATVDQDKIVVQTKTAFVDKWWMSALSTSLNASDALLMILNEQQFISAIHSVHAPQSVDFEASLFRAAIPEIWNYSTIPGKDLE